MYLLGIDIGTSSIKVAVVEIASRKCIATALYPESEVQIKSIQPGWAEQSPLDWWLHTKHAIKLVNKTGDFDPKKIQAIGIAYQMHGLVVVGQNQDVLRDSIIWCDSRAVELGEKAFKALGSEYSLSHMLNSPGNFTASKLAWVKENEPALFEKITKVMLPGDFIGMMLTSTATTTIPALSEGIFWDFQKEEISEPLMAHYQFSKSLIPKVESVFAAHGELTATIAEELGLSEGIPVSYKAGDQPNNALSLNVLRPGEVAATAGTSGVIYGVSDQLTYDKLSRINTFAHVNYSRETPYTGVLLCINGAGSMYRWAKQTFAPQLSYDELNQLAAQAPIGSNGLLVLPFGNGAERMLNNTYTGAQLLNIDLNVHDTASIFRAVQEGIAFAFRYGLDIMRENGMQPKVIKAGKANLFLSELFTQTFVDVTGIPVELHGRDGSVGAALGAGIGAQIFQIDEAFETETEQIKIRPRNSEAYEEIYQNWKKQLADALSQRN